MSRADKVTAEPRADDLLASIRRAIDEEGLDDLPAPRSEPPRVFDRPRLVSDRAERKAMDSSEIAALREKISRELNQQDSQAAAGTMAARSQPGMPAAAQSRFASLLGGDDRVATAETIEGTAHAVPLARAVGQGRPKALPLAPRLPPAPVAPPLRSAFDQPLRTGSAYRPPFGQSPIGIRSFQPPPRNISDGMISPEATSVAASSFNRLSEQILGRENSERSIDDLARELLHPMLKQWLDQNLPRIVEKLVREEIERVARRGR